MNITFIGGGNMASAIIGGLIRKRWPRKAIRVVEIAQAARQRLAHEFKVKTHAALDGDAAKGDCIVLAVKPQQLREVAAALRPHLASQLIVTIAAGIRVKDLSRWLGGYPRIVRVMPNTPALVHAGVSGLYAPAAVGAADRTAAGKVLGAVGGVLWLEREEDLDAVTAVSGSGPAYVFYFIEALERAARELGLSAEAAHRLAIETFAGAVKLAAQSSDAPETLRGRVTSKGGTTERALRSMEGERVKEAIVRAVRAAAERSRELGDELGKD
ncbi:MAG: pyrroline-5-carboxylate reductase [Betaproteobacteria bacterium]|nr:pyrroline-5-carboxylate reductase [Betaproteobacteria bacterium]